MTSLYNRYRPKELAELVGQDSAVEQIQQWLDAKDVPHAIMLTGPSGVGKTTIARILARKLKCSLKWDFIEQNCADFNGIDSIRDINRNMRRSTIMDSRVYLLDEMQQATSAAQNAMLKMLEDTPPWVYFMMATTDPQKIIKTVHTRCSKLALKPVDFDSICALVKRVAKAEGKKLTDEVVDKIAEVADGSPRAALVALQDVMGLPTEDKQLNAIQKKDMKRDSIEICRALLNPRTRWADMAKILSGVDLTDSEGLRHMVLGYAKSVLLKAGPMTTQAARIIDVFQYNTFDSKSSGFIAYCHRIVALKK